jgi:hypothetical protein
MPLIIEPGDGSTVELDDDPVSRASGPTNGGIYPYMYNKIRITLNAIHRKEGFPARSYHTVAFYGLLMFSIPFDHILLVGETATLWSQQPNKRWRAVKLGYKRPSGDIAEDALYLIPYWSQISRFAALFNQVEWPIYENLLSYGGLNNKVIDANWDKIKLELNREGY